jgi:hypothetical protein
MRKSIVILCGIVLFGLLHTMKVQADDSYQYLTLAYSDVEQSYTLSNVRKLTFGDGKLYVTTTSGIQTGYALTTMQKLFFSSTPTGISSTATSNSGIRYNAATQQVTVSGMAGKQLNVYLTSGSLCKNAFIDGEQSAVSLSNLPNGIYIVRIGGKTLKIAK